MREIRMLRTTWRKLETGLRDGLRHRKMAKASGQLRLPDPVATAPAFDPALGEGVSAMAPPYPAKGLMLLLGQVENKRGDALCTLSGLYR